MCEHCPSRAGMQCGICGVLVRRLPTKAEAVSGDPDFRFEVGLHREVLVWYVGGNTVCHGPYSKWAYDGRVEPSAIAESYECEIGFDETLECRICKEKTTVHLTHEGYAAWKGGKLIQNVLGMLSADERELMISGTCGKCFDKLFPVE